tara:strand:+ start:12096 stop:12347 length:252 start_codon:yes stop_codon:yes gene_type:complete
LGARLPVRSSGRQATNASQRLNHVPDLTINSLKVIFWKISVEILEKRKLDFILFYFVTLKYKKGNPGKANLGFFILLFCYKNR